MIAQLENAAKVLMVSPPRRSQPPPRASRPPPCSRGRARWRGSRGAPDAETSRWSWRGAAPRSAAQTAPSHSPLAARALPSARAFPPRAPVPSGAPGRGLSERGSRALGPHRLLSASGTGESRTRAARSGTTAPLCFAVLDGLCSDPVQEPREAPAQGLLSPSDALLVPGALGSLREPQSPSGRSGRRQHVGAPEGANSWAKVIGL